MLEEDHRFKRNPIIENKRDVAKPEEDKEEEHVNKVREFKWDDVEDEETKEELLVSSEEINECLSLLSDHLLTHISGEHFSGMDAGMKFIIPIDLDLHPLLRKRFEEQWDLDSRIGMFDLIRLGLDFEFSRNKKPVIAEEPANPTEKRIELDAKIQEALPPTHRKKFTSGIVSLEDDAMVMDDDSNMVSIEIPVHFAANL